MPLYEYTCPACGHNFEKLSPMEYTGPAICPKCGHVSPKKEFSVTSPFKWGKSGGWN